MKQTITISIVGVQSYDIQVDSEQRIKTTLRVMKENIQGLTHFLDNVEAREARSGRKIDLEQTYEEEKIYTGFELLIAAKNNTSPINNSPVKEGA